MAKSINSFNFSGNICSTPELRATKSGFPILSFRVAINNRKKVGDEWNDIPTYITCKAFGGQAENLERFLKKGSFVTCTGSIWIDRYEQDGVKKDMIEVHVDDCVFRDLGREEPKVYAEDVPF